MFDNLFDQDLIECVKNNQGTQSDPTYIANCLAKKAHALSYDKAYDSPFAINARLAGRNHPGGKKDDITVVVSKIELKN